ncbi:MAG: PAS domain S-box protein [Desulfobacter sp.]|nr:MAG: PAS domain S-box protein [Desulfobacter sp.]
MTKKPTYEALEARIRELESERSADDGISLTRIMENRAVGFYRSTPEGRFIWINQAFAEMLGYDSPQAVLDNVSDIAVQLFSNASDRGRFTRVMEKHGKIENFEYPIQRRDGQILWVSESARSIRDAMQNIIAHEGMVVDITRRRQAEEEKKGAEQFILSLINALPVPVFYKDRAGRYQGFNDAFESFFGQKREALIGKSVFDINPEALAEIYHAKDEALFESGGTQRYESQVQNARGEIRDVIFDKSVFMDKKGRIAGLIGTVLDITEKKESLRALQESEARFRAIFDDANDGILVAHSEKKTFVMANNVICRMLGYSKEELFSRSVHDIHPEQELPDVLRVFKKQARQEIKIAPDIPVKRKNGSVFYADINTVLLTIGEDKLLVGIFRDVTQRREMEAALKKSEERFREMADLLPGAVVETDEAVNITYMNRMGMKMFGYDQVDIALGMNGLDRVCPEQRDRAARRLQERIQRQSVSPTEYRMLSKDLKEFWVYLNASPIIKDGQVKGFRIVLTDINEQKKMESEREDLIGELQDALAEIKTLRGIVPICSKCKKIRDDKGYWNILENFIQEHSEASFSHSLCPQCSDELYGNESWYQKMKKGKTGD